MTYVDGARFPETSQRRWEVFISVRKNKLSAAALSCPEKGCWLFLYSNSLFVHAMGRVARYEVMAPSSHARKVAPNRPTYLNHWNQCNVATLGRKYNRCKPPKVVARVSKSSPKSSWVPMLNFTAPTAAQVAQWALFRPIWQP